MVQPVVRKKDREASAYLPPFHLAKWEISQKQGAFKKKFHLKLRKFQNWVSFNNKGEVLQEYGNVRYLHQEGLVN